ncbi:MAG TPA: L-rhamnose mutarotase [bacterium]|nr:L-rhamnose mutarotase [bacterium]HOZ23145.1 L-rhamnose mutarotase [bacterium]
MKQKSFASIIGLKPEYRERYIVLHRHTFPEVLQRIHASHISDYTIFLRQELLFSHMVYEGDDYAADMADMAADPATREWWQLTDPMQQPLPERREGAKELAEVADECWQAILARDLAAFGAAVRRSFEAQIAMFPNMVDEAVRATIMQYRDQAIGWKLSGAGGGGYLTMVARQPIAGAMQIKIRRKNTL